MSRRKTRLAAVAGAAVLATGGAMGATAAPSHPFASFDMVRSGASVTAGCLRGARAKVTVASKGPVEVMRVSAEGLPPKTDFDFFVTQLPNPPFGVSWYQGDLETNARGRAQGTFVGRFSVETFAVAPGSGPAPSVHRTDATTNPPFAPVHTYHLGLWFNSPRDATAAGCAGATTPFNGDHTAGVQALSTRQFPNDQGPLRKVQP